MSEPFIEMLEQPHGNALGRTVEVVDAVLADPARVDELLETWEHGAPWCRLRAANAVKRIDRAEPELIRSRRSVVLGPIAALEQPSARWTVAQLTEPWASHLSGDERRHAIDVLRTSLTTSTDWIVLKCSIAALAAIAGDDPSDLRWLRERAEILRRDDRASVRRAAERVLS